MRAHGEYARYKLDGCRCYACAAAVSEYERRRLQLIAYGRWHPFVDATPVRDHVRMLMAAGIGWKRIGQLAGVSGGGTLAKLLYGVPKDGRAPTARIRPDTARRLLAVEPSLDNVADGALVDATGTVRRLHALVAIGWPGARLADRLGMDLNNWWAMLGQSSVTARRARAVRALYSELWNRPPAETDGPSRQTASRARNMARRNGWAPPMAWDDERLDDPTGKPLGVAA